MKKFICVLIALVTVLCFGTVTVFASPYGESYGDVPKVDTGVITLDGVLDESVWDSALQVPINIVLASSPAQPDSSRKAASGTAYLLWSDEGLYAAFKIIDPTPTHADLAALTDGSYVWNMERVEFWVEAGYTGEADNTYFYSVTNDGYPGIGLGGDLSVNYRGPEACDPYMKYAAKLTSDGYIVEMLVLNSAYNKFTAGMKVGTFFQIDDMSTTALDQNDRIIVQAETSLGDIGSLQMDQHDYIVLSSTNVTPLTPAPEPEPEVTPEPPPAPVVTAPQTGNADVMLFIFLAAGSLGAVVLIKSKKVFK